MTSLFNYMCAVCLVVQAGKSTRLKITSGDKNIACRHELVLTIFNLHFREAHKVTNFSFLLRSAICDITCRFPLHFMRRGVRYTSYILYDCRVPTNRVSRGGSRIKTWFMYFGVYSPYFSAITLQNAWFV